MACFFNTLFLIFVHFILLTIGQLQPGTNCTVANINYNRINFRTMRVHGRRQKTTKVTCVKCPFYRKQRANGDFTNRIEILNFEFLHI